MSEFSSPPLINQLFDKLKEKNWKLVTAESCTGGMIATAITDKAGSSAVFERGFVTYSNEAKIENLGVSPETLKKHGAVSEQTAIEMAKGALQNSHADIAVSVTGIAGPDGGSSEKPVGLVYIGYALKGGLAQATQHNFTGSRVEIRLHSTREVIKYILNIIK
ncbi:MAG: CinA family protein [Alphaproteobacteria bacterium]|nr:CinA family protein [Alphaproteobacteria bacterium]